MTTVLEKQSIAEFGNPKDGGKYLTDLGEATYYLSFKHWTQHSDLNGDWIVQPEYYWKEVSLQSLIENRIPTEDERQLERMRLGDSHHGDKPNGIYVALKDYDEWLKNKLTGK